MVCGEDYDTTNFMATECDGLQTCQKRLNRTRLKFYYIFFLGGNILICGILRLVPEFTNTTKLNTCVKKKEIALLEVLPLATYRLGSTSLINEKIFLTFLKF